MMIMKYSLGEPIQIMRTSTASKGDMMVSIFDNGHKDSVVAVIVSRGATVSVHQVNIDPEQPWTDQFEKIVDDAADEIENGILR